MKLKVMMIKSYKLQGESSVSVECGEGKEVSRQFFVYAWWIYYETNESIQLFDHDIWEFCLVEEVCPK